MMWTRREGVNFSWTSFMNSPLLVNNTIELNTLFVSVVATLNEHFICVSQCALFTS